MELNNSSMVTMMVSGYDTTLHEDVIKSLLSDHFSSCGEITKVHIPIDVPIKNRNKYAFISITGEDAEEKALQLNGSDFRGLNLVVKARERAPPADMAERPHVTVTVSGYVSSLPEDDIKTALVKHFSSCGEVVYVCVIGETSSGRLNNKAILRIVGDDAAEKAQGLSGSDMGGGWLVHVVSCFSPREIKRVYDFPPGSRLRRWE